MYVLQAILLILKLLPNDWLLYGSPLFSYGAHPVPATPLEKGDIKFFCSEFDIVSWWIILIPSYFILGNWILLYAKSKFKNK